jgi:poly(A) polymerase
MAERPTHLPTAPWMADPATREVIAALERAGGGGVARFVGGCVRDTLLGRAGEGLDIDIATTLAPPAVIAAAKAAGLKPVPTGVAHGTVTVVARGRPFEVTTLRRDVETDGRRAVVAFTTDWGEDAARRDFRLNALYAESDGRLHDPTGAGVADALAGRVVFVGEPARRIGEDYLRILRFFRFWAWYGQGAPDAAGLAACAALAQGLDGLSAERVTQETLKLLAAADPRPAVRAMADAGVLARIVPDADLQALDRVVAVQAALGEAADAGLRLAALCAGQAGRLKRLRLPNALRDRIAAARPDDETVAHATPPRMRRRLYALGPQAVEDRLRLAATPADAPALAPLLAMARAWTPPRFPVSGEAIKAAGAAEGPEVGRVRRAVEAWWIDNDFPDDPAAARAAMEAAIRRP